MIAEALRRLFLKPGRDRYSRFVELLKGGELALELEKETETSLVFRLLKPEEGGRLAEFKGIKLRIEKVGEGEGAGVTYFLELDKSWRKFFEHELKIVEETAGRLRERWPIEDPFPYMAGWPASDVAISRKGKMLQMTTSHFWQVAETKVLFGWSDAVRLRVSLTLEGPKLQLLVQAPLDKLNKAVGRSAEGGWLKRLGVKAKSWDELKRWAIDNWSGVVEAAVRRLDEKTLTKEELEGLNALRDKLNDDKIAREVIAPALLLVQAEKLGVGGESLRYFAAVVSGAIGGDGYVSAARGEVGLASGERAIALLWRAALAAYGIKAEVKDVESAFQVVASGDDAVRLARLYFLFGPPLLEGGDERVISHKLDEAVKLGAKEALNIRWEGLKRTKGGRVAANLTISEGDVEVKYDVYLRNEIALEFVSTDRGRVEPAARLLRLADVDAEVKRAGGGGEWQVWATTDKLAAGRKELKDAIADIVKAAVKNGWVDAGKAERWLEKLRSGITLKEGWPKYKMGLARSGSLEVRYRSTNPDNIEREARRLRAMGLVEGRHFAVKMPEGGGEGYVSILKDGLMRAAWLSVHGSGEQQRLAAEFVEYILQRAREEGDDVYRKAEEIVRRGREVGSLRLTDIKGKGVDVGGRRHVVDVLGGEAEFEKGRSGRTLLRITITADIDAVRGYYEMTYGRYGKNNKAVGYAYIREEADAERFAALVEALTGKRPRVYRVGDKIAVKCSREHLDGFARYAELAEAIAKWLEETKR
jgi:hypothetical protein